MNSAKSRILFFGTPVFAARILETLFSMPSVTVGAVVTQPDRPAGRGKELSASPVKQVAQNHGVTIFQPERIKGSTEEFRHALAPFGLFDISVVVAFGQILPVDTLQIARLGAVNTHASILPRWRGAAPIQRAIMAGDNKTGVALMKMDAGMDTGPVYLTQELNISNDDTFGSLHDRLCDLACIMIKSGLPQILSGSISAVPQSNDGVTLAKKISNQEAQLDWKASAIELERRTRGLSPAPGAFCFFGSKRLKVFRAFARGDETTHDSREIGTATATPAGTISVKCGIGTLDLYEVQLEGKKRMLAKDLLLGLPASATPIKLG